MLLLISPISPLEVTRLSTCESSISSCLNNLLKIKVERMELSSKLLLVCTASKTWQISQNCLSSVTHFNKISIEDPCKALKKNLNMRRRVREGCRTIIGCSEHAFWFTSDQKPQRFLRCIEIQHLSRIQLRYRTKGVVQVYIY